MKIKTALAAIRRMPGMTVRHSEGEYRVTYLKGAKDRREAVAYYTNDAQDAFDTACHMFANKPAEFC